MPLRSFSLSIIASCWSDGDWISCLTRRAASNSSALGPGAGLAFTGGADAGVFGGPSGFVSGAAGLGGLANNASPPMPPALNLTSPGSCTLPDNAAVKSRATLACWRNSRAKQVSIPSPYLPCQAPLSFW